MSSNEVENQPLINLGTIVNILLRFKYLIIVITLLAGLYASYKAYFKPSIYRAMNKIELKRSEMARGSNDMVAEALGGGVSDYEKEIEVLRSKYMALKALEYIDLSTRYFVEKNYKINELYKQSPFVVNVEFMSSELYFQKINITPVDDDTFKLEIKDQPSPIQKILSFSSTSDDNVKFSKVYSYGEDVSTELFKLKIEKIHDMQAKHYYFSYVPNRYMEGMIRGGLNASMTSRNGSIMAISYEDNVPKRAQDIVKAVTQAYIEDQIDRHHEKADRTLKFIDAQLADISKVLDASANKLKTFKQTKSIVNLENSAGEVSRSLKEAKEVLRNLILQESILENLKEYIENNENLNAISISSESLTNQSIYEKIDLYHELSKKQRSLLASVTEFHPDVISITSEMRLLKDNIEFLVKSSLKNLQSKIKVIKESMKEYKDALYAIPQKAGTLATLNRSYSINERMYTFLLEKRAATAILEASRVSNIRVIESAELPLSPIKPNRKFMVLTGLIVGFLLSSMIAFILYFRDDSIKELAEVENATMVPFFGLIPFYIKGKHNVSYEEAFRTLRTNLEFVKIQKSSKVVLIASSISGEGKSTTIKNLAEMLVKLNRKVIVLDYDLRRPSLHKYFKDIKSETGLSMLISGQKSLQECLQKTEDGIDVIAAGPIPPNPSELIMSDGTDLLLKTLSKTYDYILIDTPPYSVVTDATILMQKVDIVLFSLMVNYSKRKSMKLLNELVEKYELPSVGIVYNGLPQKKKERHGYGYYDNK